jgi:glycosidase
MWRASADPASLFNFYRRLIAARRTNAALTGGSYRTLTVDDRVLTFLREAPGERVMAALNFSGEAAVVDVPGGGGIVLVASGGQEGGKAIGGAITVSGYGGVIVALPS